MLSKHMRYYLIFGGLCSLLLAVAFYFRWSWIVGLWPWSGEGDLTPLSSYFLSSIFAAIALPNLWIGVSGEFAAMTGGALNLAIACAGTTIYMLQQYNATDNSRLLTSAIVLGAGVVAMVALVFWARRFAFEDQRPTPLPVRVAFALFTVVLIIVGWMLITKRPKTFPWPLRDEASVVYGWIFLGAAAYFAYGLFKPRWSNACGQLAGFLAYDVVLILPFLDHFDVARGPHRTSLIVYTTVVIGSGLLATYYLFLHPGTRFRSSRLVPTPSDS